jgi:hypothetical protein
MHVCCEILVWCQPEWQLNTALFLSNFICQVNIADESRIELTLEHKSGSIRPNGKVK